MLLHRYHLAASGSRGESGRASLILELRTSPFVLSALESKDQGLNEGSDLRDVHIPLEQLLGSPIGTDYVRKISGHPNHKLRVMCHRLELLTHGSLMTNL